MEYIPFERKNGHIEREKQKARQLRKTQWWQNRIAAGICHYCKKQFAPAELTMDHIVPLSRGGKSTKGNVVPCCKDCNSNKKYFTPVEMVMDQLAQEKKTDKHKGKDNDET